MVQERRWKIMKMGTHSKVVKAQRIFSEVVGSQVTESGEQLLTIKLDKQIESYMLERYVDENGQVTGEFTLFDNRIITAPQRRKIYALFGDIVRHTGNGEDAYDVESIKQDLKLIFCEQNNLEMFSLSENSKECTVTTASMFITFLLDFCQEYDIGLSYNPVDIVEDIKHYLIHSLYTRKCVVCWMHGEVHHVDTVGMGGNRKKTDHGKHQLMCLCRQHHTEYHKIGGHTFAKKHHVAGVLLTEEQYQKMNYKG